MFSLKKKISVWEGPFLIGGGGFFILFQNILWPSSPFPLPVKLMTLPSQTKKKPVTLPHPYPSILCCPSFISGHIILMLVSAVAILGEHLLLPWARN